MAARSRRHLWYFKLVVKLLAIGYIILQTLLLSYDIAYQNPNIQLTTVDKESNSKIYHPLYTFCPIFNESADVTADDATLNSVLLENHFKSPHVYFIREANSIPDSPRTFSTWMRTHSIDKQRKDLLIQCTTFEFSDVVIPGQKGGKVKLTKCLSF